MRRALLPLLAVALAAACAHAPSAGVRADGAPADVPATAEARPARVLVTGSRIPRRVDPRTGLPELASPIAFYGRQQLVHAGAAQSLGAALYRLDTAIPPP